MLPWGEMMRAALSAGITPEAFWRLSLREWRWMARSGESQEMDAASLRKLMADYPDKDNDNGQV